MWLTFPPSGPGGPAPPLGPGGPDTPGGPRSPGAPESPCDRKTYLLENPVLKIKAETT